jgi:hypothetical protein
MRFVLVMISFCFACSTDKPAKKADTKTPTGSEKQVRKVAAPTIEASVKPAAKKIGDSRFVIQFPTSKDQTEIKILPLADFKMNVEYPASLVMDKTLPLDNLAGKRKEPSKLTEKQLQFVLPAKTDKPVELKAMLDFSVCNEQACEMVETEVKWTVKPGA